MIHATLVACMNMEFGHVIAASACIVEAIPPIRMGCLCQPPPSNKMTLKLHVLELGGGGGPNFIDATVVESMKIDFAHVITASACIVVAWAPIRGGAFPPPPKT